MGSETKKQKTLSSMDWSNATCGRSTGFQRLGTGSLLYEDAPVADCMTLSILSSINWTSTTFCCIGDTEGKGSSDANHAI